MNYEENILEICDEWQNDLADMASRVVEAHHREVRVSRDSSLNTTQWFKYNVRSREMGGIIQIHWLKTGWVRLNGKNKLVSDYLKPSVKYGYYDKSFRGASSEELLKIMAAEEKLSKIRKRLRVIGLIKNAIKLNQKSEIDDPV